VYSRLWGPGYGVCFPSSDQGANATPVAYSVVRQNRTKAFIGNLTYVHLVLALGKDGENLMKSELLLRPLPGQLGHFKSL